MGKTVGSRFGKMLIKIQDLKFDPGIVFAICTNQLHLPKKRPRKAETGIKDGLWGNGTRISVWNIPTGKTGLPFYKFRYSRKFYTETTRKVMFHLLSNGFFENVS